MKLAEVATQSDERQTGEMIRVEGGTFRMGSNDHYREEAPIHRVSVDGFWIDHTPVANRKVKEFCKATRYVTTAQIPPDPANHPDALPHMIYAGSLVFFLRCAALPICATEASGGRS